jgi:hypothetical protein
LLFAGTRCSARAQQLHDFLIRMAGIIGGIVVCSGAHAELGPQACAHLRAGYAWRVSHAAARLIKRTINEGEPAEVLASSGGLYGSLGQARKRQSFMK